MNLRPGAKTRVYAVMKAEFIHIVRDPVSLFVALIMPVQMMFLFGYTLCFELRNLPLAVCDMDHSVESRAYIEMVDNTSNFKVAYYLTEYRQAREMLDEGRTRCAIIIPEGFSRKIKEYLPADIQTLVDGTDVTTAHAIVNQLSSLNSARSVELATAFLKNRAVEFNMEPVVVDSRCWYNQSFRDYTFTITGIFSLCMMGFVPMLSALAIVREKESGSIQQIFSSPVKPFEYIAGKMSPYVLVLTLDFILVILLGLWWFKLPLRGSFLILSAATFMMIFATVAIGFFISTTTKNQLTAMLLAWIFTLMPAFIFGDAVFPIENSPEGLRLFTCLFPARFYTGICRAQILKGASFSAYWVDAAALSAYCVAIFSLCVWRIKNKKI
ncbi:MAG: ABC transporter permease [Syntrophobacteraceae bacterium]